MMQLKKTKRQQGIRTKSDYVPEEAPEASAVAQKAAMLMFQKQQQQQQNPAQAAAALVVPNSPPKPTGIPNSRSKRSSVGGHVSDHAAPSSPKPKYVIHSYATNKNINIDSNRKVTSEPSHISDTNATSNALRKASSTSGKSLPKINTKSASQQQQPAPAPSSAALAAASLVAKSNPRSMISPDGKAAEEDQLSLKTPVSRTGSLHRADSRAQIDSVVNSRRNSITSSLARSPYSLIATNTNNNNNNNNNNNGSQFSFNNSHSSLQLHKLVLSDSNRSSQSLISTSASRGGLMRSSSEIIAPEAKPPLQTEVIQEELQTPGLGLVITAPTPMVDGSTESFSNSINSPVESEHRFDDTQESAAAAPAPIRQLHPYAALFSTPGKQTNAPSPPMLDNTPQFLTENKNYSNGSDLSQLSEYRRSSSNSNNPKKAGEEFLYQSPFVSMKKANTSDSTTSALNDASPAPLKRKPPPMVFGAESLMPPPSNNKRLSLSSDFDIEDSPQLSTFSFSSSTEDLKPKVRERKPPPPLSPGAASPVAFDSKTSSYFDNQDSSYYLAPPGATKGVATSYDALNESRLTFDDDDLIDDDLSSVDDSTTLNESHSALPQYPTYTSSKTAHHHHPHMPRTRKFKNNARAIFGRGKQAPAPVQDQVYYLSASDQSNANLNPATTSQTAILIPQQTVKLRSTMRSSKKGKEFNVDKPWKHHNDIHAISEQERKRYEGVWVANRDLCMDLTSPTDSTAQDESLKAAQTASQKITNQSQLMHGIIVRDIFKRSRLPMETLKKIYKLVDHHQDGFLRKDEFTVGMWLIDQCLYGRKLPKQVDEDIWESVHNTAIMGVNISKTKKKKK